MDGDGKAVEEGESTYSLSGESVFIVSEVSSGCILTKAGKSDGVLGVQVAKLK